MCLPPECLHMLCVRGFMAVPPSARIPDRPGVRGHRGALYSWPAGPAQPCHPPAERESYTQTHRHTACLRTHRHVHTPGQITSTDAHAGQPCRHWCILERVWKCTTVGRNTLVADLLNTQDCKDRTECEALFDFLMRIEVLFPLVSNSRMCKDCFALLIE